MYNCCVEITGSQAWFYVFNQVFEADENLNFDQYLNEFAINYGPLQQKFFLEFWFLNGDTIAADEYWRRGNNRELINTGEEETSTYNYKGECTEINTPWDVFYESIYAEQFETYSIIFYKYYQHLHQSLRESIETGGNVDIDQNQALDKSFVDEFKQLELLGLPTAFDEDIDCSDMDVEDEINLTEKTKHGIKKVIGKKKKNRKLRNVPEFLLETKGMLKYWRKRFSLFSRYDEGIRLDCESWFSVTPEKIAIHLANRLQCDIIIDAFCGCGGNSIQFAKTCKHVISIDIDPVKLSMAKHNADIYGVSDKIDFICGDFLQMSRSGRFRSNVVFLSPPWGGPKYKREIDYDVESFLQPCSASELMEIAKTISKNVAFYLPRNSCVKQVIKLAGKGNQCELEHNYLDSRLVAITAFYGEGIISTKQR
ncbi:trimethylguanosine synthase isoform X2 [Eurosta solidaginis]|uniref:trimethylguanosine synthase isoform X2 n=1 Tax=Eurosta solidaginis TaxID=178769 RepID=UPI003531613A